jgi:hypothetical protein
VPEGYKTGSYSAFTLFSEPPSPEKVYSGGFSGGSGGNVVRNRPRARELTPFCGILKVGGMVTQQWGIYNPNPNREEEGGEEDVPVLSQSSTVSNESVYAGGNKRRFEEEEEEGERTVMMGLGAGRVLAVPRRKKMEGSKVVFGQENLGVQVAGVDGDFGEAEFLDYGSMGEVEMGGV